MVHFNNTERSHELWSAGIMLVVGANVRAALRRREPSGIRVAGDWPRYLSTFPGPQRGPHARGGRS